MKKSHSLLAALPLALVLLVGGSGCVNQRLIDLNKGTSCSAHKVQSYAKQNNLTYEQALEKMRTEDADLWAKQEAEAAKHQRNQATVATEKQ